MLKRFFYIVWILALALALLEAVTYGGFIEKHLGLDLILVSTVGAVICGIVLLFVKIRDRQVFSIKTHKQNVWLALFLFVFFIICKLSDSIFYTNFVFSLIHVMPDNLLLPSILAIYPVVLRSAQVVYLEAVIKLKSKTTLKNEMHALSKFFAKRFPNLRIILLIAIFTVGVINIYTIYKQQSWLIKFMVSHPLASYEDKMRRVVGPIFYNYTLFINKYTPENARVLLPPQAFPWPQSGNGAYMRYFIYPRTLGNGEEFFLGSEVSLNNFDYILLAWGETDTVQDQYTHGWPKFDVSAEKIVFMNEDGSFGGEKMGDYKYLDYQGKKVWGLIKIRH